MQNSYRQAIADYIAREARPVDKYSHQPRLYALAAQIATGGDHDDDVLFAAAWLHDLGVFIGHRPEAIDELVRWDHVAYVLAKAPGILLDAGFPTEKVPAVLEAIRTHQPQDDPKTVEGTILRDADILEQLGAVGILRTVCKVGGDSRFHTFDDATKSLERALVTLPQKIRLEPARALAEPKIAVLRAFLDAVAAESQQAPGVPATSATAQTTPASAPPPAPHPHL